MFCNAKCIDRLTVGQQTSCASPVRAPQAAVQLHRCLWGTDWTRATCLLTYRQAVNAFRVTEHLSDSDRVTLMGGSVAEIYRWSPGPVATE